MIFHPSCALFQIITDVRALHKPPETSCVTHTHFLTDDNGRKDRKMKANLKKWTIIIVALVVMITSTSCKSKKANAVGETTEPKQDKLSDAMGTDGIDDEDVESLYFTYKNGHYRKNVSTSPEVYWGDTKQMQISTLISVMNYIEDYFKKPDNGIPVTPVFTYTPLSKYFGTVEYNSISDWNISVLDGDLATDYAGRINMHFEKEWNGNINRDRIETFQIELSQNTLADDNEQRWEWIILHELGHGFGLNDIYDSHFEGETVMYYSVDGFYNPKTAPAYYTIDAYALSLLYGN